MALAAVKTFVAAEVLYAADLNALNTNILNNPIALVSPWTGEMQAGGYDLTGLDEVALNSAGADATAAGRLRRNGAVLTWHDGTAARNVHTTATGAAAQSDMETATSTTTWVAPGVVQYHPGVVKTWNLHNDTGAVTASYNVASVTDTGVGNHLINLTTAMSAATQFGILAVPYDSAGYEALKVGVERNTASSYRMQGRTVAAGNAAMDCGEWWSAAFGDQ